MKPHNNKIPFPFWGNGINNNNNSEDETTQKQDPIPLAGEWDNNNREDETTQKQDPIPLAGEWDNWCSILQCTVRATGDLIRDHGIARIYRFSLCVQ